MWESGFGGGTDLKMSAWGGSDRGGREWRTAKGWLLWESETDGWGIVSLIGEVMAASHKNDKDRVRGDGPLAHGPVE